MDIKKLLFVQGSRRQRTMIYLLTLLLAYLVGYACDFILADIPTIPAPKIENYTTKYIPSALSSQSNALVKQLFELNEKMNDIRSSRQQLKDNSEVLKRTVDQLTDQQRVHSNKGLTTYEEKIKATNLNAFIQNQKQDQALAQSAIQINQQQQNVQSELRTVSDKIAALRVPAESEYKAAVASHQNKVAVMQIGSIILLLLLSLIFLVMYQNSKLKLIALGVFLGVFIKTVSILDAYFPIYYFKYVIIAALIGITIYGMIQAIQFSQSKQVEVLLKRYRDAYAFFICPSCEFPIRRGPMKFAYWTRRTLTNVHFEHSTEMEDPPYTCPVCATVLFKHCKKCQETRYALLPACQHCGDLEEVS